MVGEDANMENKFLILTWKNISAWTKEEKNFSKRKKLLVDVSGMAQSGRLTAILSPSGGGKTTLLAALSKRFRGDVTGEILVNGCDLSEKQISCISGYMCQKPQNYEDLTVYEHLIFMARLKMDKNTSSEYRHRNVLKVTKSLLLDNKLNMTICSLSGGQKKRLTLAVQLLTEPRILFCDEPTTGLDSYNATQVVKLLRALADEGKMVLCAIHQPTSGIFELFDDFTLLASNGKLCFHGRVSLINSYLTSLGIPCPENFNLCEFIVSQVTVRYPLDNVCSNDEQTKVERIKNAFTRSKLFENLMSEIQDRTHNNLIPELQSNMWHWERESVSVSTEFCWLLWRIIQQNKNDCKTIMGQFFFNMVMFGFIALLFTDSVIDNHAGIKNTLGFLYIFITQISYSTWYYVMDQVPKEIPVFTLEVADHVYSPLSFYLTKAIFLSASSGVQAIAYTVLYFSISGLHETFSSVITIALLSVILSCCACANGIFLSTAFRSIETSSLFYVPFEFINRLFCGIQIKLDSLPRLLVILKYLSFQYYSYEAVNILHWAEFDHFGCDRRNECCPTVDDVLLSLGFNRNHLWLNVICLVVLTFAWHFLAYTFLLVKLKLFAAY